MHFESAASPAPPSAAPDVRPVVLAGPGLGLYPLTDAGLGPTASTSADGEASTSSHAPVKALLPVGNRPMIEGVLRWIEDAGLNGACCARMSSSSLAVRTYRSDIQLTFGEALVAHASLQRTALLGELDAPPGYVHLVLSADACPDVLILAFESQQSQLAQYLRHRRQDSTLSSNLRIDLQCAEDDARTGTATLLGWAAAQGHLKVRRRLGRRADRPERLPHSAVRSAARARADSAGRADAVLAHRRASRRRRADHVVVVRAGGVERGQERRQRGRAFDDPRAVDGDAAGRARLGGVRG